ncbi:MAG: T9SS type A sorting domain-containing protein [Candidatus Aenigmarchaeota archaeon]|nr:T9SS type A sorting domain-containing protein [Candidatus Aenigmarchaeota archaeon]
MTVVVLLALGFGFELQGQVVPQDPREPILQHIAENAPALMEVTRDLVGFDQMLNDLTRFVTDLVKFTVEHPMLDTDEYWTPRRILSFWLNSLNSQWGEIEKRIEEIQKHESRLSIGEIKKGTNTLLRPFRCYTKQELLKPICRYVIGLKSALRSLSNSSSSFEDKIETLIQEVERGNVLRLKAWNNIVNVSSKTTADDLTKIFKSLNRAVETVLKIAQEIPKAIIKEQIALSCLAETVKNFPVIATTRRSESAPQELSNIVNADMEYAKVRVYDLSGQLIAETATTIESNDADSLGQKLNLPNGIYFIFKEDEGVLSKLVVMN